MTARLSLQDAQNFFNLPLHKKQEIANWLEVERESNLESDVLYFRRVMVVAAQRGILRAFVRRVDDATRG